MIPFIQPHINRQAIDAVMAVLHSGMLAQSSQVAAFESAFAEYCGVRHAVAVNSGTAAIHTMLCAAGVGPGDEVIITPFTFIATATPILMCGATPVFVDVDEHSYNLDPACVEAAITARTKAILAVHLFGLISDWHRLQAIADRHGLLLLEDAAQAVGALWGHTRAGALGVAGAFSTYATKNLSTGEGGVVTTDDDTLAEFARRFRHHGQPAGSRYTYQHLGHNYRMTDIAGAIGRQQLPDLDDQNRRRREIADRYHEAFAPLPNVSVARFSDTTPVYHLYTLRSLTSRDAFRQALTERQVSSGVYYPVPLYRTPVFEHLNYPASSFPVCERLAEQVLSIPCHPGLSDAQVEHIIDAVRDAAQL